MPTVAELQENEIKTLDQGRAIQELAQNEKRELTDAEVESIDRFMNESAKIRESWEKQLKRETINSRLEEARNRADMDNSRRTQPNMDNQNKPQETQVTWQGINQSLLGKRVVNLHGRQATPDYYNAFDAVIKGNSDFRRANGTTNDVRSEIESQGGAFIMPQKMAAQVIKNVDDEVFMQRMSTVLTVDDARSLGITVRKSKVNTFVWSSEVGNVDGTQDQNLKWGKRSLYPQYLSGTIDISRDFLFYVPAGEGRVLEEVAIDGGEVLEQAYLYGTGVGMPLGIMMPSDDGIPTSRDVQSKSATTFDFDSLIDMKYAMKPKYIDSPTVALMMHRLFIKNIAKAKTGQGEYLWQPSRQQGEPDRVLGIRYISSEWMPQTPGANKYFALLGDFSWYWIAYAMREFTMQRLVETAAFRNMFQYIFRCKVDGQPVKAEAFIRGQFAAS